VDILLFIFLPTTQLFEKRRRLWFYIYGFNIAIVAGLFMRLFGRLFGRWRGALVAVLGIAIYILLRTDRDGWIELATDGEQMWVQVERK
jgi:hypothetical protein